MTEGLGGRGADLEIVRSVSGNLNVFTEKFLRNERLYWVENALFCAEIFLMMGNYSKKQNCLCIPWVWICSMQNKHNICRNFQYSLLFNLVNFSKPQKLSAKPNCFWELGSRVPPLFPALVEV